MMKQDTAIEPSNPARQRKSGTGRPVVVRCPGFKCLAYRDKDGSWRSVFGDQTLPVVLEVIPEPAEPAKLPDPGEAIDGLLNQLETLPPAPRVLPRLLSALNDAESDLGQVVDLVATDTVLTAKLLRACNSAYFGVSQPVEDVPEALHRLGFKPVYQMVAAISGASYVKRPGGTGFNADLLWRHSVTTAFAAQFIAEDVGLETSPLFTAGILHDIGKAILTGRPMEQAGPAQPGDDPLVRERATYGFNHAEMGGRLLQRWLFSAQLAASVKYHHDPAAGGVEAPHAACVALADTLAHRLDDDPAAQPASGPNLSVALSILGLADERLARYHDRIRENLQYVESLCRI